MPKPKEKTKLDLACEFQQEKLNHLLRLQELQERPLSQRFHMIGTSTLPGLKNYARAMEINQAYMLKRLESALEQNDRLKQKLCKTEIALKRFKKLVTMLGNWLNEARNEIKKRQVDVASLERGAQQEADERAKHETASDNWAIMQNRARDAFYKGFYE